MKPQSLSKLYTLLESVNIRNQQLVNSLSNPRSRETSPLKSAPLSELYTLQQQNNQLIEDVNYLKVKYKELSLGTDELIQRGQCQKKHIKELLTSLKMKDDQLRRMRIRFNIIDVSDDIRLPERSVMDYALFLEEQIQQLDNKNKPSQIDELLKKKSEELQKSLAAQEKIKGELSQLKKQYQKDMLEINQDMCELQESIKANEVIKQQEIEQRNRVIDQQTQQIVKQSDCFNQLVDVKQINEFLQSNLKELESQNQDLEAAFTEINKLNVEQHHYIAQVCKELNQVKQQLNKNEDRYKELLEEKQQEILKHQQYQKTSSASKAETTKFLEKSNALQTRLETQEVQITQLKQNTKLQLAAVLKQLAQFRTYIKQLQHDTLDDQQIYHQFVQQLISEQPQGKQTHKNSYAALMKCVGILNQLQVDRGQCNDLKTEVEEQLQDRNTICEQQMLKLTRYCESQMCTFKEDTKKQMDLLIFDLNEQHDIIYKQERQLKALESQLQDESTSYNHLLDKYNRLVVSSNELTLPLESGYDLTIQQLESDNQQYQLKFQRMSKELAKLEQTKQVQEQQITELTRNFKDLQICAQLGLSNVNEHKTAMEQELQQKEEALINLQLQSKLQIEDLTKQLQAKDIEMAESLMQMRQSQLSQLEECMSNQMDSPLKQVNASPQLTMQFKDWEQSKQLTQSQETMEELEKSTQQVGTLQQQVTNLNQQVHNLTSELSQKQHQYDKMQVFWKQSVAQKQKRKQQLFKELLGALSATKAGFMVHKNQISMELEKYRGYSTQTIQGVFEQVYQLTDVRENLIELAQEQSDFKQFLSNQHPMQIASEAVMACKEYFCKIILELQQQVANAEQQIQEERQLNQTETKNKQQQTIDQTMKLSYELQQSELKCENLEQQLNGLEKMLKAQQDQNNQLKQDNKQMANGFNVADVYSKLMKKEQEHQNEIQLNKQFEEKLEQKDDELIELKQVISNLQKQLIEEQQQGKAVDKSDKSSIDQLRSNIVSALLDFLEAYSTNDYEMNDYKDELYRMLDLSKNDKDKLNGRFQQLKKGS